MKHNSLMDGAAYLMSAAQTSTDTTNEYLAAYDAMMARRSPQQAADEARINAAAHCNQVTPSRAAKAYRAEAAGIAAEGLTVTA